MMNSRLLILSIFTLAISLATAQTLTQSFSFEEPAFNEKYGGYSEPVIAGCLQMGIEGEPTMPFYSAEILLPQGKEIGEIKIVTVGYSNYITGINIVPADRPFPISLPAPKGYKPQPNGAIYNSDKPYPEKIVSVSSTQFLGGYSIGVVGINPMEFLPVSRAVRYIKEITVEIQLTDISEKSVRHGSAGSITAQRVEKLVCNPELIPAYHFDPLRNDEVDLLVITKNDFVDVFQAYVDYKTERGFAIEIATVEDIYANYPGADNQAKIRNCIIDYYENHGLTYVILGGDSDGNNTAHNILPHRGFYVDTGFGYVEEDLPSDMYYACLDGSWDNNNNGWFGEPGEEDLYAEVFVGRMCVDSPTEISNMINKLIKYQETPVVADIERALMVGEALDDETWGGDSKDDVAYGSSSHGYTTEGLSDNFNVNTLYEKNFNWNKNHVFNEYSNLGLHLRNHLGHSSVTYNMKMDTDDLTVSNFQNNGLTHGFVIGYSQGCYNGSFDNRGSGGNYSSTDCFSEKITTMATAEVANIGNSRYGWYQSNTTNGASQYFDRQFFDAVFGEDLTQIGIANGDSKEDNAAYILSDQVIRWCAYELILFGDPTMDIWTAQPVEMSASYPAAIPIGSGELQIETDVPFARIGLMQNGDLIGRGVAGSDGNLNLSFFGYVSSNSIIDVFITGHNKYVHSGTIAVITDQPYVIATGYILNDDAGNGNGMPDYGETVQLGLTLQNVGNQSAENVSIILSSNDAHISLPYLVVDAGNFDPGQTITLEEAFEAIISENVPDLHKINIEVQAQSTETWYSEIELTAWAPNMMILGVTLDDSQGGDGNSIPDPGEEVMLEFNIMNQGHSPSQEINMVIESLNEHFVISSNQANHDALGSNENGTVTFFATVNQEAVTGDIGQIQAEISSGSYSDSKVFSFDIAVMVENFETGDFTSHSWEFAGNQPWSITSTDPYEGSYCICSGAINHNQSSEINIGLILITQDTVSFYRKVSSEGGYDFLKFYIDNTLKAQWSGEEPWQEQSFVVPPGIRNLRWVYEKDQAVVGGQDCAWIDFIKFPATTSPAISAGPDGMICQGESFQPDASGVFVQGIIWSSEGDGTFNNTNMLKPTYTPGSDDIQNGQVVLYVNANGVTGEQLSDEVTLFINGTQPDVPEMPTGDMEVCTNYGITYQYYTSEVTNAVDYLWELIPQNAGAIEADGTTVQITWTPDYTGIVHLQVKAMNGCGESEFSQYLEIVADICTGIFPAKDIQLNIYPNPTTGLINIDLPKKFAGANISIYNTYGQEVFTTVPNMFEASSTIDIRKQPAGIYFIKLTDGTNEVYGKILKE
jgi:hypothetical protein